MLKWIDMLKLSGTTDGVLLQEHTTPQAMPLEGWPIWYGDYKFQELGRATFDVIIFNCFSETYWEK